MKKEWQRPSLEELNVKMTLLGETGSHLDNDFPEGTGREELTFS
ncbi:paeninodin family lasso peptide [Evansella halocellulosilytica]|nr:paeninodin family lasso peptide [Evansella halocellulosilytica]